MAEVVQVDHHEVVQVSTQIQRQVTHQAHWERTVRDTPETVVEVEPAVAEPMEGQVVQEPLETQVVLAASQDLTQCRLEDQRTTDPGNHPVAQAVSTIQQAWPKVA